MNRRILIIDDEESIRRLLDARFSREGWQVDLASDGIQGLEKAVQTQPTVVITDIKMPGLDGFQLLDALNEKKVLCPVIVITGHGEKECAIEAIHKGAFDYLEKPFDMDEISHVVKRANEREQLRLSNVKLLAELKEANHKLEDQLEVKTELLERTEGLVSNTESSFIGESSHIRDLKETLCVVAKSFRGENDPIVLITGESGVGKEVIARYLHSAIFSVTKKPNESLKNRPFVAVNCAAFPDQLLESELFGYEKGAFTGAVSRKLGLFELAQGGTLFLDEIGELDLKMQAKLLRSLQERMVRRLGGTADIPVRATIFTATNRDLKQAVTEGKFREDLYYRLNTLPISVAPLRNRVEDVDALALHFLKILSVGRGKKITGFSANALKTLRGYQWPGNVRELRSVIERAVILEKGPVLELSHLRQEHLRVAPINSVGQMPNRPESLPQPQHLQSQHLNEGAASARSIVQFPGANILERGLAVLRKEMDEKLTRQILVETLDRERGNVSAVARALKLDRANLLRMLKRFSIEPSSFRNKQAS